jgi:hypothetical protein
VNFCSQQRVLKFTRSGGTARRRTRLFPEVLKELKVFPVLKMGMGCKV